MSVDGKSFPGNGCLMHGLLVLFAACALVASAVAADDIPAAKRVQPWPAEIVEAAARIPVQEGGRIKPLDTYARFTLLRLSGKRSVEVTIEGEEEKQKLSAIEWLLDVLFYPAQAHHYPVFLVEDYDALSDVGMSTAGMRKRDRHSFARLRPIAFEIIERGQEYSKIDAKQRSPLQTEVVNVAQNLMYFHRLLALTQFARVKVDVATEHAALQPIFPGRELVTYSELLRRMPDVIAAHDDLVDRERDAPSPELKALNSLLREIHESTKDSDVVALFPPPEGEEEWLSPGSLAARSFVSVAGLDVQLELLAKLESLVPWRTDEFPGKLEHGIEDLREGITGLAGARGEASEVGLEVFFYRAQFFFYAQWLFVLAFVVGMLLWLAPGVKALYGLAWATLVVPWLLLCIGITVRCILRDRPPVSTLYESILFIAACGVLACGIAEWINRGRVALFLGSVFGAAGLFLAGWYEDVGRTDTMPQLQAVLDTNFWLSTHVTTVTIGYAAGFLAAVIAHVYLLGKLFGFRKDQPAFYRGVARMTYGAVCFGLVFSTIGTILGGVWANDSWGRFWGWDPKENGALMIVLSNLIILHARLSGWIRDFGTCLLAIPLATVVAFSWFHTNVLGVGLHAYGFDSRIATLVWNIYYVEWTVFALGVLAWWLDRRRSPPALA